MTLKSRATNTYLYVVNIFLIQRDLQMRNLQCIELVLRKQTLALLHKIQEHEIRRPLIQLPACLNLRADTAFTIRGVRAFGIGTIGHQDPVNDLDIQEMVHQEHESVGARTWRPIQAAVREIRVGDAVLGFEDVVKLREDVGDLGGIGTVVYTSPLNSQATGTRGGERNLPRNNTRRLFELINSSRVGH